MFIFQRFTYITHSATIRLFSCFVRFCYHITYLVDRCCLSILQIMIVSFSILADPSKQIVIEEVEHPGQCPIITAAGPCLHTCRSDGDCPSDRKCCYNGCGNTCRSVTEGKITYL